MSYRQQLGKVKGDAGKIYVPSMVTRNNKKYITWTLQDEGGNIPQDIDITPKFYLPNVDDNGYITFTLVESGATALYNTEATKKSIKGAQGPAGAVNTVVRDNGLPPKSEAKEGIIYIHDNGIATVYDEETDNFYDLDDLLKFNNYSTTVEIQENYYNKNQIDNMFGNIIACQQALITLLDKDSIIDIPSDD